MNIDLKEAFKNFHERMENNGINPETGKYKVGQIEFYNGLVTADPTLKNEGIMTLCMVGRSVHEFINKTLN